MTRYAVKKVDGAWEIFPVRHWLGRVFGMSRLVPTTDWIWVTRFDTQAEAFEHAHGWAQAASDGVGLPHSLRIRLRDNPRAKEYGRRMGYLT